MTSYFLINSSSVHHSLVQVVPSGWGSCTVICQKTWFVRDTLDTSWPRGKERICTQHMMLQQKLTSLEIQMMRLLRFVPSKVMAQSLRHNFSSLQTQHHPAVCHCPQKEWCITQFTHTKFRRTVRVWQNFVRNEPILIALGNF